MSHARKKRSGFWDNRTVLEGNKNVHSGRQRRSEKWVCIRILVAIRGPPHYVCIWVAILHEATVAKEPVFILPILPVRRTVATLFTDWENAASESRDEFTHTVHHGRYTRKGASLYHRPRTKTYRTERLHGFPILTVSSPLCLYNMQQ